MQAILWKIILMEEGKMWKDNDDRMVKMLDEIGKESYPQKCPICEAQDAHLFMYKPSTDAKVGSSWVWCSACKQYAHMTYRIPQWWENYSRIDPDELCASPEQSLDDNKMHIDEWINALVANKAENITKESETIEDDMNLYEITILPTDNTTEEMISVVSTMCNCDKDNAKLILDGTGRVLPQLIASDTGLVIAELKRNGIKYTVSPDYKW